MQHAKKIILLGAGFTTRNMGVWALTSGAINAILHAHPDADITMLDYHREPAEYTVRHSKGEKVVKLANIRFSKKVWLPNNIALLMIKALLIKWMPVGSIKRKLIDGNPRLKLIHDADLIGSVAGGDSFSDIYGFERLFYVGLPQFLVLLMGKPLVVLPQTIGPFDSVLGKAISGCILRHAEKVYIRDHRRESVSRLNRGRNPIETHFCYDMGFALEPKIENERMPAFFDRLAGDAVTIGINVSGLLYIGGYTGRNMFGLQSDYKQTIHRIIDHFLQKENVHVLLVPHVFGNGDNRESDTVACRDIYQSTKADHRKFLHVVDSNYDHHEIKAIIGKCDMFIGSRMHACIAALSQSIPAMGLAYSKKFAGVFETIGMEEWVVDLRQSSENDVIESIDWGFRHRLACKEKLQAVMPTVKSTVMNLFSNLKTIS